MREKVLITHFQPRPVEPDAWVQVIFFSQGYDGNYYCGYDFRQIVDNSVIQKRIRANCLVPVSSPHISYLQDNQRVWITPDYEVFLASKEDPIRDPKKILLHKVSKSELEESMEQREQNARK